MLYIRLTGTNAYSFKSARQTVDTWNVKYERVLFITFSGNKNRRYGKEHEKRAQEMFADSNPTDSILTELRLCINVDVSMFTF